MSAASPSWRNLSKGGIPGDRPFREGNGRSTRELFDLLLSERGAGLDWQKTDLTELHSACHTARAESDIGGLAEG